MAIWLFYNYIYIYISVFVIVFIKKIKYFKFDFKKIFFIKFQNFFSDFTKKNLYINI